MVTAGHPHYGRILDMDFADMRRGLEGAPLVGARSCPQRRR